MRRLKQLLPFEGGTVLGRILDKVAKAGFGPVFLVVGGPHNEALRRAFSGRGISIVTNPAPEPGGTITSIRCGLRALDTGRKPCVIEGSLEQSRKQDSGANRPPVPGFLLHPSDFPAVSPETYNSLFTAIRAGPDSIIVPIYRVPNGSGGRPRDSRSGEEVGRGRRGHPVWFPSTLLRAFMDPLPGGARDLLRIYDNLVKEMPVEDPGVLLNVDTPADYAELSRFAP